MVDNSFLPEEARNRLLRRVDWRFLLPSPQPRKSICFANGLLSRAVKLISEQVVDHTVDLFGDCDLAVATNPKRTTLEKAWNALRPGGFCYIECYSPLTGGSQRIRRRMAATGFEGVTCYWAWPWPCFSSPRSWLLLGESGASRHFLLSRPPARGIVRRFRHASLQLLWRASLLLDLTLPICAVAYKPPLRAPDSSRTDSHVRSSGGSSGDAATPRQLLERIRARWSGWGFGPTPGRLSSLILTGGHRSIGKVVWLVFAEPDHHPRVAVKLPRVPESIPGLNREATTLRYLQTLNSHGISGIPRVLFCEEHSGLLTVGETALVGQPLARLLTPESFRSLSMKVTAWLADLAGQRVSDSPVRSWNRLVQPVLDDFTKSFGRVVDPGMLRETENVLMSLGALPAVCEQRDFGPWNVLLTAAGELAVLDWESSEPQGLPAMDLIYFLSFSALSLHGGIDPALIRARYRDTLNPSTPTGGVVRECVERYAAATGLDPAQLRGLRLLCWLLHSRSEYGWFIADFAKKPEPENLRRSIFLSFWEQEIRHGA